MANIAQLLTEHIDIWTAAESEKKSGRGNASSSSNSVYGVKKLCELILELAISGKIVKSEENWKQTKLGDIGVWAIGSGFPTADQGSQTGNILFAKVSDMNNVGNEKFIFHTNNTITEEVAKKLKANIHSEGTVIFPKIGGAIATNKRRILVKPTAIDNNCLGITPKNGVTTDWLYLILSAIDFSKYQAGTSVPALAQGVLQEIQVMLPSVAEQHRIVTKVDELMALCDQLEQHHSNAQEAHETLVSQLLATLTRSQNAAEFNANWQRIYAHFDLLFTTEASIDALKQTLLQLAVMGKLVPQDPDDEPASELLKRIQAEKAKLIAEGKLKKEKPLSPITDEEKPFELPQGWEWVRVNDIGHDWGQKTPNQNFTYIEVSAIDNQLGLVLTPAILKAEDAPSRARKVVKKNTIIYSTVRPYLLNVAVIDTEFKYEPIASTAFAVIQPYCEMPSRYFLHYLRSPIFIKYVESVQTGIAYPAINDSQFYSGLLPLPPIAEQYRIVAKVDELMALCDQLKTRLQQAGQQQQAIADALVAQAVS